MNAIKRNLLRGISAVLTLSCLGCNLLAIPTPVSWTLTRTPSPTPQASGIALPNLTPLPPARVTPLPSQPHPQVTGQSSWLVYSRGDGKTLVALNTGPGADSPPVTITLPDPLLTASDLRVGASPNAGWLALRTGSAGAAGSSAVRRNMALRLVHLPDGAVAEIAPLLSPTLEKQIDSAGTGPLPEPAVAVTDENALSWSPNGRYLAYIAASDGPSSDLYVYDLQTRQSSRLTKGARQAATPIWSPDSRWIITQEIVSFGSGAGWQATAVWAAAIDHSEIRRLYTPPVTGGGERFLGWSAADSLVVATWTPAGVQNVRELPLSTRWLNPIFKGPADTIAFDPASRWFYFTSRGGTASIPTSEPKTQAPPTRPTPVSSVAPQIPGLYRLDASGDPPELVIAGEWRQVSWLSRSGLFVASGAQGILLVAPDGQGRLIKNEGSGLPSPNGLWIAGWGDARTDPSDGVHLYQPDGTLLQEVSSQPAQLLFWTPDSSGIYFQSGATLYHAGFPNPEPQAVDADVLPMGAALVPAK